MKIKEVAETKLKVIQEVSVSMLFYKTLGPLRPQTYLEINVPIWKKEIHDFFQWLSPLLFLFALKDSFENCFNCTGLAVVSTKKARKAQPPKKKMPTQTFLGTSAQSFPFFFSSQVVGKLDQRRGRTNFMSSEEFL